MTGQAIMAAGFFVALMACQPLAYLLEQWVEHTEAEDQARSRTPDGSTLVDSSDPQALSTPWAGVELHLAETPPAHPNLVPAATAVPLSAAGTKPTPLISTQSPVGAVDPHLAAFTGLNSPPPQ